MRLIGLVCLTLVLVASYADAFGRHRRGKSNACAVAVASCTGTAVLVAEVVPAPKTAVAAPTAAPVACVAVQTGCVGAQSFTARRGLFKRRAGCGG